MANIQEIKELRDMTGCGLSDCKKALEEANDNREEAVKILSLIHISEPTRR